MKLIIPWSFRARKINGQWWTFYASVSVRPKYRGWRFRRSRKVSI